MSGVINLLSGWLDLFWIPVPFLILPRHQWLEALTVIVCASFMMRLQVELVETLGYTQGLTGFLPFPPYYKALVCYSLVIFIYIILMLVLMRYRWRVHVVLSFTVFFNAFILSSIVLLI